jgi:hypothetical protein
MKAEDDNKYDCPGDVRFGESTLVSAPLDTQALPPKLPMREIDDIVYRLRQERKDTTYAIVNTAIAPYAERIAHLERELAERKPVSIDTPEFRELLILLFDAHDDGSDEEYQSARSNFIAYIDGRTAGTAPEGYVLVPEVPNNAMVVAIESKIDEQLVASGMWAGDMQRQDGADIYEAMLAAAPSPLPPKEETK